MFEEHPQDGLDRMREWTEAGYLDSSQAEELYDLAVKTFHTVLDPDASDDPLLAEVVAAFRRSAEAGHAPALVDLGRCHWNGWGVPVDREAAMACYREAADELDDPHAAYVVASNLYWVFDAFDEAHAFALRALEDGGDPRGDVRYLLGLMAWNGRGRSQDEVEALRLHEEAAAAGNADAMFELHVLLAQGSGCEVDPEGAQRWLERAAQAGQPRALYNMGSACARGAGVAKDMQAAAEWYARAAEAGNGKAAATLGAMLLVGDGIEVDRERAVGYLRLAEAHGFETRGWLVSLGLEVPPEL
jgi:uncharacterized protein